MTYSAPLPFFFKYPISFIILLTGVGTAFVPFQGRTLDVWIVAFIKSIYSPTQYIWKHGQETPVTTTDNSTPQTPIVNISAPATEPDTPNPTNIQNTTEEVITTSPEPVVETSQEPSTPTPQETLQPTVPPAPSPTPTPEIPTPPTSPAPEAQTIQAPSSLPIPFTPTTPNTLVGLTLNPNGQTLDGVLVEIKNQNITMRATKSNKLGQFLFVRPLENGLYQILAEKEGFQFECYSIQLNGEIINPLRIQALS